MDVGALPGLRFFASQVWETLLSSIFCVPNVGKRCFLHFWVFPKLGRPIFTLFSFSQHWEGLFSSFSAFPNIGTTLFSHFCSFHREEQAELQPIRAVFIFVGGIEHRETVISLIPGSDAYTNLIGMETYCIKVHGASRTSRT